jgi:hypothetical protein
MNASGPVFRLGMMSANVGMNCLPGLPDLILATEAGCASLNLDLDLAVQAPSQPLYQEIQPAAPQARPHPKEFS